MQPKGEDKLWVGRGCKWCMDFFFGSSDGTVSGLRDHSISINPNHFIPNFSSQAITKWVNDELSSLISPGTFNSTWTKILKNSKTCKGAQPSTSVFGNLLLHNSMAAPLPHHRCQWHYQVDSHSHTWVPVCGKAIHLLRYYNCLWNKKKWKEPFNCVTGNTHSN